MSRHAISDQVLKVMVGIRLESGVGIAEIRELIEKFAREQPADQQAGGGTVGFLWVEDIASDRRAEFLSALSTLSPQHAEAGARDKATRTRSATEIWG